jgi:uncharacterized oligopeptide transporter (OPT) family protein
MRKLLVAAAAAMLAGIVTASAAEVSGTIQSVDVTASMITLDNGKSYKLPATIKASDWKVGDKVKVTFEEKGGQLDATAVVRG